MTSIAAASHPSVRSRVTQGIAVTAVLAVGLVSVAASTSAQAADQRVRTAPVGAVAAEPAPRADAPEDRYALANGCYAIASADGFLIRDGGGFAFGGTAADAAPIFFEPTELGVYLLVGDALDLVAEGLAGTTTPSPATEWVIDGAPGAYTIVSLDSGDDLGAGPFAFRLTDGCTDWPEPEINVSGPHAIGATTTEEVRGYVDGHLHQMAFEFLGGSAHCGRPWHRYGVAVALVDCPDHGTNGEGAALENAVSDSQGPHDVVGWPTFADWPAPGSLTHEQTYYRWMERNWRGGLRMFTNLLVENGALCRIYPIKRNSCDEMDSVRLQLQDMLDMQNYIDAQSGGPGEGWYRIVTDPFQAREVMNDGKLAVVMGIEISVLFGCGLSNGAVTCTTDDVDAQIAEMYTAGVRQMELVNKFDSAMSGVAGDSGSSGPVVNGGNFLETGRYWDMRTCTHDLGADVHDKEQDYATGLPEQDALFGAINDLYGTGAVAPIYGAAPHCNAYGLGDIGAHTIDRMIERGMLIDPDHMSVLGREQALDRIDTAGYEGVMSSHGWSDPYAYERILEMGGVITARSGANSQSFVDDWQDAHRWSDERYYFGLGYGADANGLGAQPRRMDAYLDTPVTYPITGFGGAIIDQNVSGERVYDVNVDGVAHYGLYPDWIQGLRQLGGDAVVEGMERGPEAYLQTWERAVGIPGESCRSDVPLLTVAQVQAIEVGTLWIDVMEQIGQPRDRTASIYTYCAETGDATVTFDDEDRVLGISVTTVEASPAPLPTTGGGAVVLALTIGLAGAGLARRRINA